MSSNLRVNNIFPSVGTNVAIGTAGGSITLTGGVTGSSIINTGVTTVAAGSTSAPSISPTGDSNTGIFFPSADTIAFAEGGVEAARIDSSGRLGIGTDIPGSYDSGGRTLVISENSTLAGMTIRSSSQGAIYFSDGLTGNEAYRGRIEYSHSSDSLNFGTAGTGSRVNIDSSGRLGVGIVPKTWTSGYNVLQVGSASLVGQSEQDGQTTNWSNNAYFDTNDNRWEYSFADQASQITQSDGLIIFKTASTGTANAALSWTESARFNTSGNLAFPSGQGIDFSATANSSGTMTSELLSDYEEGTWTPTLDARTTNFSSVTYGNRVGYYTRVGNMVYISCYVSTTAHSGGSGELRISGTPFTITGGASDSGPPIVCYSNSMTSQYAVVATPFNTALWELYYYTNSGGFGNIQVSNLPQTSYIKMAGSYRV